MLRLNRIDCIMISILLLQMVVILIVILSQRLIVQSGRWL